MVIRVLAVSLVVALSFSTPIADNVIAGSAQACYAPGYGTYCGPPSPTMLCGAVLGKCSTACGLALRAPACIMMGVLAPPPCGPQCGVPAPCGPQRVVVSKTRPVRACAAWNQCGQVATPVCGCGAACAQLAEMPMRFATGVLSIPPGSYGYARTY